MRESVQLTDRLDTSDHIEGLRALAGEPENRIVNAPETIEHLRQRLNQCEHALQRCERLELASRYAGAVMHEVNNPLAAITNLVFLTKLQANEPERVVQNMEVIESQLKALGKVTGSVLAFHRDRSEPSDTDLIEIVESALKLHSDKMTAGNVALTRDLGGPATARVFASDILQVLSNLLLNALDALPSEGAFLIIRVRARPNAIHIAVADNGSGIPSHIKKTLFEPYTTSKQMGTGLGLWLSRLTRE